MKEPLKIAAWKAYRASAVGKLETLLKLQTFWKRRQTIADNTLRKLRTEIEIMAMELAREKDKHPTT